MCLPAEVYAVNPSKDPDNNDILVVQTSAGNFAFSLEESRYLIVQLVNGLITFGDPVAKDIADKCLIKGNENGET